MVENVVERIAGLSLIDKVAKPLAGVVGEVIPHGGVKDVLSGTWLGHPLHPMLTDLPIGCWTNAMALDLLAGKRGRAGAQFLVGMGVLTVLPTAASGLSDWSDTIGEDRRLGFAHAGVNIVAVTCYSLSWLARRRGDHGKGVVLGLIGGTAATGSAYLGGHLAWRRGVNVDRHAFLHPSHEWVDVGAEADLVDGQPVTVTAGEDTVFVVRQGKAIFAISDVCGHAGGPLHDGDLADGCITCPWHGSVFRVDGGDVVHGPATAPQPRYEVQVADGRVSVRRP
jgi:nitrite reductase/ring-hydroxylating ferredoxin subunit/uncharacterized membrane protein